MEEWDPELGGDLHAYVAQSYLDPGCKIVEDGYDSLRENAKHSDGTPGNTNGQRVRLVPWDVAQRRSDERRLQQAKEHGKVLDKQYVPFYPFHDPSS